MATCNHGRLAPPPYGRRGGRIRAVPWVAPSIRWAPLLPVTHADPTVVVDLYTLGAHLRARAEDRGLTIGRRI